MPRQAPFSGPRPGVVCHREPARDVSIMVYRTPYPALLLLLHLGCGGSAGVAADAGSQSDATGGYPPGSDGAAADVRSETQHEGTCPPGESYCPGCCGAAGACGSACPGFACDCGDASASSDAATSSDAAQLEASQSDGPSDRDSGTCGAQTCGPNQVCVHLTCGGGPLQCTFLNDAGGCPPGWRYASVCALPPSGHAGPGCLPTCVTPAPFCQDIPSSCAGPSLACTCLQSVCGSTQSCASVQGHDVTCGAA
jgi:hypothetical protein